MRKMRKLFFPLVAVLGVTAMTFTKANTQQVNAQEVSLKRLTAVDIKGVVLVTEHLNTETLRIYTDMRENENRPAAKKMANVLSKY